MCLSSQGFCLGTRKVSKLKLIIITSDVLFSMLTSLILCYLRILRCVFVFSQFGWLVISVLSSFN